VIEDAFDSTKNAKRDCSACFRRERDHQVGLSPTYLGHWCQAGNFQHRGLHFCGSCDGVGV